MKPIIKIIISVCWCSDAKGPQLETVSRRSENWNSVNILLDFFCVAQRSDVKFLIEEKTFLTKWLSSPTLSSRSTDLDPATKTVPSFFFMSQVKFEWPFLDVPSECSVFSSLMKSALLGHLSPEFGPTFLPLKASNWQMLFWATTALLFRQALLKELQQHVVHF